ncbi:hypothetical protein F4860DRAFT_507890 [Xylaria cubensis]|nr:hypothetical protein F4860DRAFT_507890 [Xylaria cubensis]
MASPEVFRFLFFQDGHNIETINPHDSGETIATARLHGLATTKADMTLWGRHECWKKEYNSFTSPSHLMLTQYSVNGDVERGQMRSFGGPWRSTLSKHHQMAQSSEAEARLEMFEQALSREQLKEIVVSCAVERERFTKSKNNKRDVEIIGELLGGAGGDMSRPKS